MRWPVVARAPGITAFGVFLAVAATYTLTGPGRIDIIDGQIRYEVATNLVNEGRPVIRDPALRWAGLPAGHDLYAPYNAGASIAGLPLVWLGLTSHNQETQRFLFSFTSALAGGFLAAMLYLFYLTLGVEHRAALKWVGVSVFGTMIWPLATSTFDQMQHAALILLAVQLGRASARKQSYWLAMGGGLAVAALLNYQESYALLVPALALSTLGGLRQGSSRRFCIFLAVAGLGLLGWLTYNAVRFGDPLFFFGKFPREGHPSRSFFGNPIAGFLSLLFSPGKSILLYSPPVVLGLLGIRGLWRKDPALALTVVCVSTVQLLFISSLRFFGSDWAWGPRYLVPLLPLWALPIPFTSTSTLRRNVRSAVVALGIVVQVMAVSVDHQRFFFERGLPSFFWATDQWFYFRESALLARPGEIIVSLRDGVPNGARRFAPSPYPDALTYAIAGYYRPELAPSWMRQYQVFYLPRPWPLWMRAVSYDRRPVALGPTVLGVLAVGLLGAALISRNSTSKTTPGTT